jgi:hypothetical protein
MRNSIIPLLVVLVIIISSCGGGSVHKQYAKCGTKLAKKKHVYYNAIQHK